MRPERGAADANRAQRPVLETRLEAALRKTEKLPGVTAAGSSSRRRAVPKCRRHFLFLFAPRSFICSLLNAFVARSAHSASFSADKLCYTHRFETQV